METIINMTAYSETNNQVSAQVTKFENLSLTKSNSSTSLSKLWFYKDGLRSPTLPDPPPRKKNRNKPSPPPRIRKNTSNKMIENKVSLSSLPPIATTTPKLNQHLRNSLEKMDLSEKLKLEEILDMCVEYEKQIEAERIAAKSTPTSNNNSHRINGGSSLNGDKSLTSPSGTLLHQNRIKTNGSLPRDKRLHSPAPGENDASFNFTIQEEEMSTPNGIKTFIGKGSEGGGEDIFSTSKTKDEIYADVKELMNTSSLLPPRSKHDPSSPAPDPVPSKDASQRVLIGTTMLNNSSSINHNLFGDSSFTETWLQKLEILKSERHAQVLVITSLKRKLSDLELHEAEGIQELELERSLLVGERTSENEFLEKSKKRCNELRLKESQLSQKFQDWEKSIYEKTESAKIDILKIEREIKRLEELVDVNDSEELKTQIELLEIAKKTWEDMEFRHLEESASREVEKDELNREIKDLERKIEVHRRKSSDIGIQQREMLDKVRTETNRLESQRHETIAQLRREKEKLEFIEEQILKIQKNLVNNNNNKEEEEEEDEEDEEEGRNYELEESLNRLALLDDELKVIKQQNGRSLNSVGGESNTSTELHSESSGDDKSYPSPASSLSSSIQAKKKLSSKAKMRRNETTTAAASPISDSSSYWEDSSSEVHSVKRRSFKNTQQQQRPLTRYLPIRNAHFDLRQHIETAGHPLHDQADLIVNSFSCRGYLQKMGSKFSRKWNRRWFVFDRNKKTLVYYRDKTEAKPKGGIYFQAIEEVYVDHLNTVKSPKPKETFCMKTSERTYYLLAPSPEIMRIWVDVIFTGAEGYQGYNNQ